MKSILVAMLHTVRMVLDCNVLSDLFIEEATMFIILLSARTAHTYPTFVLYCHLQCLQILYASGVAFGYHAAVARTECNNLIGGRYPAALAVLVSGSVRRFHFPMYHVRFED
jgi:hypothetical protein